MLERIQDLCRYLIIKEPIYKNDYYRFVAYIRNREFEKIVEILESILKKEHLKEKKDRTPEYPAIIEFLSVVEEYLSKININDEDE